MVAGRAFFEVWFGARCWLNAIPEIFDAAFRRCDLCPTEFNVVVPQAMSAGEVMTPALALERALVAEDDRATSTQY